MMNRIGRARLALFLASVSLAAATSASAQGSGCATTDAAPLTIGTVASVPAGAPHSFTLDLGAREGIFVDLVTVAPNASGDDDHDHGNAASAAPRNIRLCDAAGRVLAPQPGEVFAKGGSVSLLDDGERLKFHADAAGRYVISVAAADEPRELLVRRRRVGTVQAPIVSATLGAPQKGLASSSAPMVFSFSSPAGQWVELKSTSENDTLLRLAAPDREGNYSVVAEVDDSDGLNPVIRRRLPIAGTYFVQVDSLSDEPGEFSLSLQPIAAPKPPPPPAPLRLGAQVSGKLADGDAVAIYALPVAAGRSYRLELTAPYDGVVAIGVPNPVEPEDGGSTADAGFTEIRSQDGGVSGTERLNFTARSNGSVWVRVRSYGIGETDGSFTLTAVDLGG